MHPKTTEKEENGGRRMVRTEAVFTRGESVSAWINRRDAKAPSLRARELTAGEVAAELGGYMPEPMPTKPDELHGSLIQPVTRQIPMSPVELDAGDV